MLGGVAAHHVIKNISGRTGKNDDEHRTGNRTAQRRHGEARVAL